MSAYLLDTHTLIWWFEDAPMLSAAARDILQDPATTCRYSAASVYEADFKTALGKLSARIGLRTLCATQGFQELSITCAHAEDAARLALVHRDPWDRLIAAQAMRDDLTVITRDPAIAALGAKVLW